MTFGTIFTLFQATFCAIFTLFQATLHCKGTTFFSFLQDIAQKNRHVRYNLRNTQKSGTRYECHFFRDIGRFAIGRRTAYRTRHCAIGIKRLQ